MARALNLMVAANLRRNDENAADEVWGDIRLTEAAVEAFALRGDVGSLASVKKPRQLSPVDSVAVLALEE
eukprot:10466013-Alexandrium_andersonii.AAC.1